MDSHRKGILYIIAAALLWSTGGIGIKAVDDPALKVTFYRSLFASIALFAFFGRGVVGRRAWKSTPTFVIAILSYAACLTSFVVATKWTTAANAIFLQYAGVIWVLLLSPLVLREPMRTRDVVAVVTSFCGMALFFVGRLESRGMAGNFMALVSSFFFAALILAIRKERDGARAAITWGNVATAACVLPFTAHDLSLTPRSALVFLFLGLFQIALAYVFFVRGLSRVTATEASLTGMLEPVANPIWVFLLLGERPSPYAVAGAAVVLVAIGWHTLTASPTAAADLPPPD